MRFSDRAIQALQPAAAERVLWDDALPGFGLRLQPSGARSFIVQYRAGGGRAGRLRKLTLGRWGAPWTTEGAREEARKVLAQVRLGEDPAGAKLDKRKGVTVSALCDWYLEEGVATKKASTLAIDRNRIARHIKPLIGMLKAADVTRAHVERFLADVAMGKSAVDLKTKLRGRAIVTGGKGAATRTVGLLGAIFTFAVNRGVRPDNPVRNVKRFPDRKGERHLAGEEWAQLGQALAAAEAEGANPSGVAIIRLLALTGARKGEVRDLRWREVDLEGGRLTLADSKTREKVVPLGAPAVQLLSELDREDGQEFVFPGERTDGPFSGLEGVWRKVRKRAGLEDVRLHDLRHSYASRGLLGGAGLPLIGAILGHRDTKTTARYAHLAPDPVKRAADRIAGDVHAAMAAQPKRQRTRSAS